MTRNQVRIIGGLWKGRKLRFAAGAGLRPTPSRVRETLFNWLGPSIEGCDCLDLFAGSGALGFEALSRGARSLTLVERDRRAAEALRRNGAQLGAARLAVRRQDALAFLRQAAADGVTLSGEPVRSWDCIFLDPPFATGLLAKTLALLSEGQALKPDGRVYFEARRNAPLDLRGWQVEREGHAGDCRFGLLRR